MFVLASGAAQNGGIDRLGSNTMSVTIEGDAARHPLPSRLAAPTLLSHVQLRERLHAAARRSGAELAVVDVRETLTFSDENLIFSTNLALNRLEMEAPARLPRRDVPIVLVDADGTLTPIAYDRLQALGYTDIAILDGGLTRWKQAGFPVYAGFNVRSKAFAECVEHHASTPFVDFVELQKLPGRAPVILDSRTRQEYHRATVPNAIHAAGADLVRVVRDLVPCATTPIVVACGGRTRSIIGAQSLIDAGVPNPVYSLRNGTGGLRLAGYACEQGAQRYAPAPTRKALDWARAAVKRVNPDVPVLDSAAIAEWRNDADHTLYLFDLRDVASPDTVFLEGVTAVAGGQLVQEIDLHAPVIGARIILIDVEDRIRATMTACWLTRLGGFDVAIASAQAASAAFASASLRSPPAGSRLPDGGSDTESHGNLVHIPSNAYVDASALARERTASPNDTVIVDLSRSPAFRAAHPVDAVWAARDTWQQLSRDIAPGKRVVLTSEDGRLAALAWRDWAIAQADDAIKDAQNVRVLLGGNRAWRDAALPLQPVIAESIADRVYPDVWMGPQQRGGDVLPQIRAYLDWEVDLVRQVEHDPDFHALLQLRRH